MVEKKLRKKSFKILVLLVSAVLVLVLAELALRAVAPLHIKVFPEDLIQPSIDPAVSYELNPGWPGHNRHGLRGPELENRPGPGPRRILVAGDSIAYGLGVEDDRTLSVFLENRLRTLFPEEQYEVLNLGVPGYDIGQVHARIRDKGLALNPETLVYVFCLNDIFMDAGRLGEFLIRNRDRLVAPVQSIREKAVYKLYGYQLFQRLMILYKRVKYPGKQEKTDPEGWAKNLDSAKLDAVKKYINTDKSVKYKTVLWENLEHEQYPGYYGQIEYLMKLDRHMSEIAGLCKQKNIRPLVCIVPIFYRNTARGYVFEDIHALVRAICERNGLQVLDLAPVFASHPKEAVSQKDRSHPNDRGNEIMAEAVLRALGLEQRPDTRPEPARPGT